jgi:hypothetical protein
MNDLALPSAVDAKVGSHRDVLNEKLVAEKLQSGVETLLRVAMGPGGQLGAMSKEIHICYSELRENLRSLHETAVEKREFDSLDSLQVEVGSFTIRALHQKVTGTVNELIEIGENSLKGTQVSLKSAKLVLTQARFNESVANHLETVQLPSSPSAPFGDKARHFVDRSMSASPFDSALDLLNQLSETFLTAQQSILRDAVRQCVDLLPNGPQEPTFKTISAGLGEAGVGVQDDVRVARINLRVALGYLGNAEKFINQQPRSSHDSNTFKGSVHNAVEILGRLSVATGNTTMLRSIIENPWNGSNHATHLAIQALALFGSETDVTPVNRSVHEPHLTAEQRPQTIVTERRKALDCLSAAASRGENLDETLQAIRAFGFEGIPHLVNLTAQASSSGKALDTTILSAWCRWASDLSQKPLLENSTYQEARDEAIMLVTQGLAEFCFFGEADTDAKETAGRALLKLWPHLKKNTV